MPIPLIPIVAGILIRQALKKAGTTAAKKLAKKAVRSKQKRPKFRSATERSSEEQALYLRTIQAAKETRAAKRMIRSTKKLLNK